MRRILTLSLFVLFIFIINSCESKQDIKSDVEKLELEREVLQSDVKSLSRLIMIKREQVASLDNKLKELNIYDSDRTPRYILKIRLKQSRMSLDVFEHAKDNMNAIEFEIPVDKGFYDSVDIGTKITDEFRRGSLILNGSFSNWDMTVKSKKIK